MITIMKQLWNLVISTSKGGPVNSTESNKFIKGPKLVPPPKQYIKYFGMKVALHTPKLRNCLSVVQQ